MRRKHSLWPTALLLWQRALLSDAPASRCFGLHLLVAPAVYFSSMYKAPDSDQIDVIHHWPRFDHTWSTLIHYVISRGACSITGDCHVMVFGVHSCNVSHIFFCTSLCHFTEKCCFLCLVSVWHFFVVCEIPKQHYGQLLPGMPRWVIKTKWLKHFWF